MKKLFSKKGLLAIVGLVIVGCVGIAVIAALGSGGSSGSGGQNRTEGGSQAAATLAPLAPPYQEIEDTVASMTEVQWKAYLQTLAGNRVDSWTGWIVEVDQSLGGKYTAWIDMDPPGAILSTQDVYVPVGEDLAMKLNKGDKVVFSGQIERCQELLGTVSVRFETATLEVVD
jgi:hypothetical protein